MCPKCSNQGRYYTQSPGVTQVIPCHCEGSRTIREMRRKKFDELYDRITEMCRQYEEERLHA